MLKSEPSPSPDAAIGSGQQALLDALDAVLAPLADLCLAKGLRFQSLDERLRAAFVKSAIKAHGSASPARAASHISATTGLSRREVTRRVSTDTPASPRSQKRSPAAEVFTRWMSIAPWINFEGQPLSLPRLGAMGSFERLAQSVTQDIHPRSLLDELCRLGLACWDSDTDRVALAADAFVPTGDWARQTAFLGDNVGDHLLAATANVLGTGKEHMEQALYADELSTQSRERFQRLIEVQWARLLKETAPELEKMIEADAQAGRKQDQRVRVGLYTWAQTVVVNIPPKKDQDEK